MMEREGVRVQTYEAIGRGAGVSCPMRPVVSRIDAERAAMAELDWVDLVGIAHARDGMGQAALF